MTEASATNAEGAAVVGGNAGAETGAAVGAAEPTFELAEAVANTLLLTPDDCGSELPSKIHFCLLFQSWQVFWPTAPPSMLISRHLPVADRICLEVAS
jgi:hypothetical protein